MGDYDRDRLDANVEKTRGTLKENVGDAIDNEQMEYEGKLEKGKGEVREGYTNLREDVDDSIDRKI